MVTRGHIETGVDLTYVKLAGESVGDAGDQYTGLDRFGRVKDQRWLNDNNTPTTYTDDVNVDRFLYNYDRNSNRLTRVWAATDNPGTMDQTYAYDKLNRLVSFRSGELIGSTITDPEFGNDWMLDALGNWLHTDDGNIQDRTHNARNELTAINYGNGSASLTYDNNGNMRTDEKGNTLVYDAWNRLVQVKDSEDAVIVSYEYDALSRRIAETKDSTTRKLYFSQGWQVIEEKEGSLVTSQNIWSLAYVDAMVLRDRDATSGGDLGKSGSGLDERVYVIHDANFNVTAIVNTSGSVVERFGYEVYGSFAVLDANFGADSDSMSDIDWKRLHQGGAYEVETGLYHFRNRDYGSTLGRWVQQDPSRYADGQNMYQFVSGNAVNHTDPSGLFMFNTHFGMTWRAAMAAGISDSNATRIADENIFSDVYAHFFPEFHAQSAKFFPFISTALTKQKAFPRNGSFADLEAMIGMTSHALQDFFSHTDFVEAGNMNRWYAAYGHFSPTTIRPRYNQILPMDQLAAGTIFLVDLNYYAGGALPHPHDPNAAHTIYAADARGEGRDRFLPGAFERAKTSARLQTQSYFRWLKNNLPAYWWCRLTEE